MDILLIYFIGAIILSLLTRSPFFVILALLLFMLLICAAVGIYFIYAIALLMGTKPAKGSFVRTERLTRKDSRFFRNISYNVAVYNIDGEEYRSVFPAEGVFGIYFYSRNKTVDLRLNTRAGVVFDRYNVTSCILYPIFSLVMLAALIIALYLLIRYRWLI